MTVGSAYKVCTEDEGKECSDSNIELSIDVSGIINYLDKSLFQNHLHYFNLNISFAVNGCPGYNPYH